MRCFHLNNKRNYSFVYYLVPGEDFTAVLMFLYRFKALETIMAGKEEMNRCDKRVSFSSS